jgi:hypothetical protein
MRRVAALALTLTIGAFITGCSSSPTAPTGALATGRWTGDGACLSVADTGCNLVIGCGHGQFSRPTLRADSTFDVDGTYRIEVGPVSIEPAPPAHFSGSVIGVRLLLTLVPSAASVRSASYSMTRTGTGECVVPCV